MERQRLEGLSDSLFRGRLTTPAFLQRCIDELKSQSEQNRSAIRIQDLTSEIETMQERRGRVVDTFIEGLISREERDRRLSVIDSSIDSAQERLIREVPSKSLDAI